MKASYDIRQRWFSVLFIGISAGLLIWGNIVFAPYLQGLGAIFYWGICLLFAGLAVLSSALDAIRVLRRARAQHVEALQRLTHPESVPTDARQRVLRNS